MGYTTTFKGDLKFTPELTASQLAKVKTFLGEDCRDHPEWNGGGMTYIDLELLDDFSGIKWDGSEKTYDLDRKVNLIIQEMRKEFPSFNLEGKLLATGEDAEDRWWLTMENGTAIRKEIVIHGQKFQCPHCRKHFILDQDNQNQ